MKKEVIGVRRLQHYLQCYGEFNAQDAICRTVCALRLRCAVEHDQQGKMEILEDLFNGDEVLDRIH